MSGATRYKVIETALCIGESVFEGEEVAVHASDYDRLAQESEQWRQRCSEAQAQRDQYQDQRDAALKQVEDLRKSLQWTAAALQVVAVESGIIVIAGESRSIAQILDAADAALESDT